MKKKTIIYILLLSLPSLLFASIQGISIKANEPCKLQYSFSHKEINGAYLVTIKFDPESAKSHVSFWKVTLFYNDMINKKVVMDLPVSIKNPHEGIINFTIRKTNLPSSIV